MNNECKKALGELTYEAPRVDVLEVMVERGFANSIEDADYYGESLEDTTI
jgi:hypothetical protein